MDFKVAGTREGITAIQMDIKIDGVTPDLMRRAIHQAKDARLVVLDKMGAVIDKPRDEISLYAPRIYEIQISPSKIKDLIGPRGKTVQGIQEETGVTIDIEDDGRVELSSFNAESANKAEEMILSITAIPEVGKEYPRKSYPYHIIRRIYRNLYPARTDCFISPKWGMDTSDRLKM